MGVDRYAERWILKFFNHIIKAVRDDNKRFVFPGGYSYCFSLEVGSFCYMKKPPCRFDKEVS